MRSIYQGIRFVSLVAVLVTFQNCTPTMHDSSRSLSSNSADGARLEAVSSAPTLASVAASMQPGTWIELQTVGMQEAFSGTGGSNNFIISYADAAVYDPVTEQIFFMGSDHGGGPHGCPGDNPTTPGEWYFRHVGLRLATNTWRILPNPSWHHCYGAPAPLLGDAHGYDKTAIDPARRLLYRNPYGNHRVFAMNIDTETWSEVLPAAPNNGTGCCNAITVFPELGGLVTNEGSGSQMIFNSTTKTWSYMSGIGSGLASTWMVAEYSAATKSALLAGVTASNRPLWKVNSNGVPTRLGDIPVSIYEGHGFTGVTTTDPVSGKFLFLTAPVAGSPREFWILDATVGTGQWVRGPQPPAALTANNSNIAATPVDKHGVTAFITCKNPNQTCGVYLYKHSDSTPPPPDNMPPPGTSDFQSRCSSPGVLNCFSFDSPNELSYTWSPTSQSSCNTTLAGVTNNPFGVNRLGTANTLVTTQNIAGACVYPVIDTTVRNTGAGSLKMTIPSNSGSTVSGSFTEVFKRLPGNDFVYIAPGSPHGNVIYFQWKQRWTPDLSGTNFLNSSGGSTSFKQVVLYGDPNGPSGTFTGGTSSSDAFSVVATSGSRDVMEMYGHTSGGSGVTSSFNLDPGYASTPTGCTYSNAVLSGFGGSGFGSRPGFRAPWNPGCIHYTAYDNQWVEFTIRIEVCAPSNAPCSRVQQWVNGVLNIDVNNYAVNYGTQAGRGYGAFELTPYMTGHVQSQTMPVSITWYDDVIISTQPIAMTGNSGTPDTIAPTVQIVSPVQGAYIEL